MRRQQESSCDIRKIAHMNKFIHIAIAASIFGVTVADAATPKPRPYSPLRSAVVSYYAQGDEVQLAVYLDVCEHDGLIDTTATRDKHLGPRFATRYDTVRAKLNAAYKATSGTDGAVEQVRADFCKAADNR